MALMKSHLVTQCSGSVGGTTYSHTRSGMYMRARSIPVNPNTGFQLQVRTALTSLVTRWTSVLTTAQRAAWNLYGANTPVTNALGDPINLSGQNWYIACNTPRVQATTKFPAIAPLVPIIDTAPAIFDRGAFTTPTFVADVSTGITVTYVDSEPYINTAGGVGLFFMSRPMNPSRNFYKGPWRLIAAFDGDTAPSSPQIITPATIAAQGYPFAAGQNIWMKFVASQPDGRLSTPRVVGPLLSVA